MSASFPVPDHHLPDILFLDFTALSSVITPPVLNADILLEEVYNSYMPATAMRGSVYWMAPEMVSRKAQKNAGQVKSYSGKIDIWSLGCVVIEMYNGRRPWTGYDELGVMFAVSLSQSCPSALATCQPKGRPNADHEHAARLG